MPRRTHPTRGEARSRSGRASALAMLVLLLLTTLNTLAAPYQARSTRRMAERLEKIASEADPMQNPFLNRGAAEIFGIQFEKALTNQAQPLSPASLVGLHYKYAYELLNAGESARAVGQFTALNDFIAAHRLVLEPEKASILRLNLIMAH